LRKQNRLTVRSLLADRFKLQVSHETKELPVYALVVAKNGPKFGASKLPVSDANPPVPKGMMRMGVGELTVNGVRIGDFVEALAQQPEIGGRVILDKTSLTGAYDFTLKWTPNQPQLPGVLGGGIAPPPSDSSASSIFTAIQEQLGLKLESTKGPVDVLVIDHVEEPSAN
jgi:bla regulator protein BlaR1